MPAAIPLLGAIGGSYLASKSGGSKLEGAVAGAGAGAALYGAYADNKTNNQNQQQSAQERAQSLGYIQGQEGKAQNYLTGAAPQAQAAANRGYSGAMEAIRGSVPLRLGAISQGNQDAQRMLLGGLPFIQQALMGQKMDLSQMTPFVQKAQIPFDNSIASGLIQKYGPQQALMASQAQMPPPADPYADPYADLYSNYQNWQGY